LVIAAIAEEMEKKTSGTIVVNRRLRKISPNGLRTAAFCLNTIPRKAPIKREKIKIMEKPYDVKNGGNLIFIFFSQSGNCGSALGSNLYPRLFLYFTKVSF
jgi:hypothetical protein